MYLTKDYSNCSVCKMHLNPYEGFIFSSKTVCKYKNCVKRVADKNQFEKYVDFVKESYSRSLSFDGIISIPVDLDQKEKTLLKSMPGAKPRGNKWIVSTLSKDRKRILEVSKKLGLKIDKKFLEFTRPEHIEEALKVAADVGLYPYQLEGVDWLMEQDNCLLADDMGLGKTLMLLMSIPSDVGTIVVTPDQVIATWVKETKRWRPDLSCTIIKSSKHFSAPKPGELFICSYGKIPDWVAPEEGKRKNKIITEAQVKDFSNCIVIYDECHGLANTKSKKSRKAKYLGRLCKKAIGATGTPMRNKPLELWGVLTALGLENEVFDSFFGFVKLFGGEKTRFGYVFDDSKIHPEVSERLRRIMLRRSKKDPEIDIQLPEKTYIEVYAESSNHVIKSLDTAWELYKKTAEFKHGNLPDITEMATIKKELAIENLKTSIKIVEEYEANGEPLVFGSAHRDPVKTIGGRKGWGMIIGGMTAKEKGQVIDDFQDGKLKGIAISLLAGNAGITLTHASHILFNDLDWVPTTNEQFEDRINRIGQLADKVFIKCITNDHELLRHIFKLNFTKKALSKLAIDNKIDYAFDSEKEKSFLSDDDGKFKQRIINSKLDEEEKVKNCIARCMPSFIERYKVDTTKKIKVTEEKRGQIFDVIQQTHDSLDDESPHKDMLHIILLGGLQNDIDVLLAREVIKRLKTEKAHNDEKGVDTAE